jgi:predicted dienelactone hydrolase
MFKAGYIEGFTTDPARPAWRSSAPRPLIWAAWYPAADDAAVADKVIGPPGAELFRMGRVAENAALSSVQNQWPVVLLSHGTGGTAQGLSWLGVHLAAKGFISIGISHHGNTAAEPYLPEGFLCWWERARDLTEILNLLGAHGPFADRLDLNAIFAAGFSLGGYTVLQLAGAVTSLKLFDEWLISIGEHGGGPREFPDLASHIPELRAKSAQYRQSVERHSDSYLDPRIKAVVALAPAPPVRSFKPESVSMIVVPTALIVGQNDLEAPHTLCALWLKENNPSFQVELLGRDVGHQVFLPEATETGKALEPDICCDPDGVDRGAIHGSVATMVEAKFRKAV